jgi:hypothetical protein
MTRIGLMFDDETGKFHRTFAKFFVAQFLSEKIFKQTFKSEQEANFFSKVMKIQSGTVIRKFLYKKIDDVNKAFETSKLVINEN